jgi:DNA-binding cell septation regulator SpoVG
MKINIDEIKARIKFLEEDKLKAIISLDFEDFTIKGFRVMKSDRQNDCGKYLWLVPPSYQGKEGKYHPIFFIPKKETWKRLEKMIWGEYEIQEKEHYKKRFDLSDDDM